GRFVALQQSLDHGKVAPFPRYPRNAKRSMCQSNSFCESLKIEDRAGDRKNGASVPSPAAQRLKRGRQEVEAAFARYPLFPAASLRIRRISVATARGSSA